MLLDHDNTAPLNLILVLIVGEIENLDFFLKKNQTKSNVGIFFKKKWLMN